MLTRDLICLPHKLYPVDSCCFWVSHHSLRATYGLKGLRHKGGNLWSMCAQRMLRKLQSEKGEAPGQEPHYHSLGPKHGVTTKDESRKVNWSQAIVCGPNPIGQGSWKGGNWQHRFQFYKDKKWGNFEEIRISRDNKEGWLNCWEPPYLEFSLKMNLPYL